MILIIGESSGLCFPQGTQLSSALQLSPHFLGSGDFRKGVVSNSGQGTIPRH
jgi:hypothetical protein